MCQTRIILCFVLLLPSFLVHADPPFVIDSPEPAAYRQLEFYPYLQLNTVPSAATLAFPGFEVDYGFANEMQLSIVIPIQTYLPSHGPRAVGPADLQTSFQYLFLHQNRFWVDTAISFYVYVPTGDVKRNLGNGKAWFQLPISFEKDWQAYTLYGSIGYSKNSAKFMNNFWYAGMVFEYHMSAAATIGAELYHQNAYGRLENLYAIIKQGGRSIQESFDIGVKDGGAFTLLNVGATYTLNPSMTLLSAIGHSVHGIKEWYGYAGLLYTTTISL